MDPRQTAAAGATNFVGLMIAAAARGQAPHGATPRIGPRPHVPPRARSRSGGPAQGHVTVAHRGIHMKTRTALLVALAAGAVFLAPAAAAGQDISYSGSLHYSTGEYYFAERTSTAYLLTGLSVDVERVRFSVDLPVIWQSTPWVSYVPGGGVPTGGTQDGETRDGLGQRDRDADGTGDGDGTGPGGRGSATAARSAATGSAPGVRTATVRDGRVVLQDTTRYEDVGVGDPSFRADIDLLPAGVGEWSVTLGGEVKAPLADPDQGFGTGEWDGGVSISVARRIGGTFVFGDLGYWVLGDMDELELQDPVAWAAGVGHTVAEGKVGLLASVSGYSTIVEGTDPPVEADGGVTYQIAPRRSVSANVSFGLTESSPDVAFAAGWTVGL